MTFLGVSVVSDETIRSLFLRIDAFFWPLLTLAIIFWVIYLKSDSSDHVYYLDRIGQALSVILALYFVARITGNLGHDYPMYGTVWITTFLTHTWHWLNNELW